MGTEIPPHWVELVGLIEKAKGEGEESIMLREGLRSGDPREIVRVLRHEGITMEHLAEIAADLQVISARGEDFYWSPV
jgi:hypothetical protein